MSSDSEDEFQDYDQKRPTTFPMSGAARFKTPYTELKKEPDKVYQ